MYYLRPLGFLYGETAREAVAADRAAWIAGGPVAFLQVEQYERSDAGISRKVYTYREIRETGDTHIRSGLDRICAPRHNSGGLDFDRQRIMGILNVTPDSFSDGGDFAETERAIAHGKSMKVAGADIIDIGGESTRPGAAPVSAEEEIARVDPVICSLLEEGVPLSLDTRNAEVMRVGLKRGVVMINDVSALTHDPEAIATVGKSSATVVLMHALGDPQTMQDDPTYEDVLLDVYDALDQRIETCLAHGISRERIIADPGIGFGKTVGHNLRLLEGLSLLHGLGVPLMLGVSRKSFIGKLNSEENPRNRLAGSLAVLIVGAQQGVQVFRVHDVRESRQALNTWSSSVGGQN